MQELTTIATLADEATLADDSAVTAVLDRGEIEAALRSGLPAELWFEVEQDDEPSRLALEVSSADLEEILRLSGSGDIVLALDADGVSGLLEEAEVEAHGLRGALAVAIVAGAISAPAGLAATPQVSSASVGTQVTSAVESQVAPATVQSQVSRAVSKSQVSRAVAKSQVVRAGAKTQVSKSLVVKASGLKVIRALR